MVLPSAYWSGAFTFIWKHQKQPLRFARFRFIDKQILLWGARDT